VAGDDPSRKADSKSSNQRQRMTLTCLALTRDMPRLRATVEDSRQHQCGRCQEQGLSQFSHGLAGRHGTMVSMPDTWQDADLPIRIPAHWPDERH